MESHWYVADASWYGVGRRTKTTIKFRFCQTDCHDELIKIRVGGLAFSRPKWTNLAIFYRLFSNFYYLLSTCPLFNILVLDVFIAKSKIFPFLNQSGIFQLQAPGNPDHDPVSIGVIIFMLLFQCEILRRNQTLGLRPSAQMKCSFKHAQKSTLKKGTNFSARFSERTAGKSTKNERERKPKKRAHDRSGRNLWNT